jgi:hypothetical protein
MTDIANIVQDAIGLTATILTDLRRLKDFLREDTRTSS